MRSIDDPTGSARYWRALAIVAILGAFLAAPGRARGGEAYQELLTQLLNLSPEMELFVDSRVDARDDPNRVLNQLIDAVFGPAGLGIQYGNSRTMTPAEIFETRSGNCLSFTMLFVTMARHLGLEARFNEVAEIMAWDQRGEFVFNNRHMFAEVEIENARLAVDFLPGQRKRYRLVERISDERALAHYFNNLGAEAVVAGSIESALDYFAQALSLDKSLSPAWVNQGVALRRSGDFDGAEASYRRALEADPSEMTAASNLAALLDVMGRQREADDFRRKAEAHQRRNPFYHYRLGLETADRGQLAEAVEHLRTAIRRDSRDPEFHAALAAVYSRLGNSKKSDQSLKRALAVSADDDEREEVRRRLAELLAATPTQRQGT